MDRKSMYLALAKAGVSYDEMKAFVNRGKGVLP